MSEKFFITTPIYYVNDKPHIGHMYTTVLADVITRYRRMLGNEVYFLTGTDEHGQKIEKTAASLGKTPKILVDEVMLNFKNLWKNMGISYDHFVRTTDINHKIFIENSFQTLLSNNDIYKAFYKGLYSINDEAYVTESQLNDMKEQGIEQQLIELEEESYFFRLSAYENWLNDLYNKNPEFVQPSFRLNEVKQFVTPNGNRGHLQDLSISRTSINWGIPVPNDNKHVIYVWFDALLNYISACKNNFWPPTLQLVGKDILRFHAVYWPAFLMAIFKKNNDDLNGPLPEHVYNRLPKAILAHGWWMMSDSKVSKTKGNAVKSEQLLLFGNDAIRFFFMREMQLGLDRNFSFESFIDTLNSDLANGLGNLASRTTSMIKRYCQGKVPKAILFDSNDKEILYLGKNLIKTYIEKANANDFHGALNIVWAHLRKLDSYIVLSEPWKLSENQNNIHKMHTVLNQLYLSLRTASLLIAPIMPDMAQNLWTCLGLSGNVCSCNFKDFKYEITTDNLAITNIEPLFTRIDKKKAMIQISNEIKNESNAKIANSLPIKDVVNYDIFNSIDLKVGLVIEAEKVPKSNKLIKMLVDIGNEKRIILGGIGTVYTPEELLNRKVVVITNLTPRMLMGIMSHGMLLAASNSSSKPYLLSVPDEVNVGSIVR